MQLALTRLCTDYLKSIQTQIGKTNEALRELLGCDGVAREDETSDQAQQKRVRFFTALVGKSTVAEYSRRLARFLRVFIGLATDDDLSGAIDAEGVTVISEDMISEFRYFASVCDGDKHIASKALHRLLQAMAQYDNGLYGTYRDYPVCVFAVVELSDNQGLLVNPSRAEKSISALKFFLRGSLLLAARKELNAKHAQHIVVRDYVELDCLKDAVQQGRGTRSGSTNTLSVLSRMAKAVNVFVLPIVPKVLFPNPTNPTICIVNNKPCGTVILRKVISTIKIQLNKQVERLLMGLSVGKLERDIDAANCNSAGWAFGRHAALDSNKLKHHVMREKRLRGQFWTADRLRKMNVLKSENSSKFLRRCLKVESLIAVLFHVLSGAGTRGSDVEYQTYRNSKVADGAIDVRNVTIISTRLGDSVLQFAVPVQKTSLLHGKPEAALRFVDLSEVEFVLKYYLLVRPFAHFLRSKLLPEGALTAKSISRLGSSTRWDRFLFVKPSSDRLRSAVERQFNPHTRGLRYNELRHFAVAVHRHFITPQELCLQDAFPVHQGFAHSRATDLGYGVGMFSASTGGCDPTSVLRCSRLWWRLIGVQPTRCVRNEAAVAVRSVQEVADNDDESIGGHDSGTYSSENESGSEYESDNEIEQSIAQRSSSVVSDASESMDEFPECDLPSSEDLNDDGPINDVDVSVIVIVIVVLLVMVLLMIFVVGYV